MKTTLYRELRLEKYQYTYIYIIQEEKNIEYGRYLI